jgi:hypothetical protein
MNNTKIVKQKVSGNKLLVTVELPADFFDNGGVLLNANKNIHYKLASQVDDIVSADVVIDSDEVYWCSISQEWIV